MAHFKICEGEIGSVMRKRKNILIFDWLLVSVICLAIVALAFVIIHSFNNGTSPSQDDGIPTEKIHVQKNPDSIAIPGYEVLEFDADKKIQTLRLSNPPQNVCYFQISLCLEDNTLLWKSELIEPGETSDPILLTQVLERGTYTNAVLKYDCFKMDGKTPLNGAETKLTLWVK